MSEDAETRLVVYLGERIDGLRETISANDTALSDKISKSVAQLHVRLNDLPEQIETAVSRAIAPLVPLSLRWWQQHPFDKMVMISFAWLFIVATGVAVTAGMMPDGLLERLLTVAGAYVEVGPESSGDAVGVREWVEVITGSSSEAAP